MFIADTLSEPVKMREVEANEDATLTDFQEELVKMCAALKGEHTQDNSPEKIVKDMKVVEAVDYMGGAFQKFRDDCETARKNGADESLIVCDSVHDVTQKRDSKSLTETLLSCLTCGRD